MKLLGDIPEWQKVLAQDLRAIEKSIDEMLPAVPVEERAKCYVSLAYDWYSMGAITEGQKLVWKAENVCPGYFTNQARTHMAESSTYAYIMGKISEILSDIVKGTDGR